MHSIPITRRVIVANYFTSSKPNPIPDRREGNADRDARLTPYKKRRPHLSPKFLAHSSSQSTTLQLLPRLIFCLFHLPAVSSTPENKPTAREADKQKESWWTRRRCPRDSDSYRQSEDECGSNDDPRHRCEQVKRDRDRNTIAILCLGHLFRNVVSDGSLPMQLCSQGEIQRLHSR